MSLHSDMSSLFYYNQYLLLLSNAACLAKKQHLKLTIFRFWGEHANPYTIYMYVV